MALSKSLTITYSANGVPVYGTDFPFMAYKTKVNAGDKVNLAVPYGYDIAVITTSSGSNFQVSPADEDLPALGSWQSTNGFINKPVLNVKYGDTLYFVVASDDYLSVAFFQSGKPS
jgi:hypothetical protein